MTQAGSVMGTVHYISPEQALGEPATPRSDLYSLGVVLYEMLTGELPYDAETPAGVVMKHVGGLSRSPSEANPDVPEELDAVTARLLSKDPEDRYPDGNALVEDLERAREGLPLDAATRERRGTKNRARGLRQRRGVLATLALVVVGVGVIAAVALTRGGLLAGEARSLPEMSKEQFISEPLDSGRYATDGFEPELSFTIEEDDGWRLSFPETSDYFEITTSKSVREFYPALGFIRLSSVFAPNGQDHIELGSDARITSAPDDVVTWLRNHPNLDVSKPTPVTVGGVSGTSFDVEISPVPEDNETSAGCGPIPCVFLFAFTGQRDGTGLAVWADDTNRLVVLEDVEGETVIIAISVPPNFKGFLPKAQQVLDTVEWKGA
jgi:serine/threonine protein kinase